MKLVLTVIIGIVILAYALLGLIYNLNYLGLFISDNNHRTTRKELFFLVIFLPVTILALFTKVFISWWDISIEKITNKLFSKEWWNEPVFDDDIEDKK